MFGRKLKTQKENVILAQEETLDMHPIIHVADSIIEYQKQLAERSHLMRWQIYRKPLCLQLKRMKD